MRPARAGPGPTQPGARPAQPGARPAQPLALREAAESFDPGALAALMRRRPGAGAAAAAAALSACAAAGRRPAEVRRDPSGLGVWVRYADSAAACAQRIDGEGVTVELLADGSLRGVEIFAE
eukprot:TRINITY_DN20249_c0_g1_i2.p2 TRINITY_DN20249_c0_g1~~TRINITY_DN20249_c0_g1_i2.p2  ORF type:complete len:122 (+),score=6.74 TRINITY_DN20249_c0_g1_i2:94-459(+)